jgi:hypothetical protein
MVTIHLLIFITFNKSSSLPCVYLFLSRQWYYSRVPLWLSYAMDDPRSILYNRRQQFFFLNLSHGFCDNRRKSGRNERRQQCCGSGRLGPDPKKFDGKFSVVRIRIQSQIRTFLKV